MTIPRETLQELVALRNRVADLEAEIAMLTDADACQIERLTRTLHITVGQAHLLAAFARTGFLSHAQLTEGSLVRGAADPSPELTMINSNSRLKRLRKRLPWLKIESIYGLGYEVEGESLARLRAIMRGAA